MARLRAIFRRNPERLQYRGEFIADMDRQLGSWTRIGSAIATVAWLDFAFNTDKKLHPEYPELLYFRLALTAIGAIIFFMSFIPAAQRHGALLLKIMIVYLMAATLFFTGRIADDPNYVSGLQDETMFLRIIEKTGGGLHEIREELLKAGDITDDLSLVRIVFEGTGHEPISRADLSVIRKYAQSKDYEGAVVELDRLYAENPHDPKIVYELALLNSRLRKFSRAAALGEEYCNYDPSDLGMIYLTSRALKYCAGPDKSLLKRAADYGERLILREPMSFHGIVNLADIYRRLEKRDKAEKLLRKAEAFDPENRAVKKLQALMA